MSEVSNEVKMSMRIKFTVPQKYDGKLVKEFLRRECMVSSTLYTQLKKTENGVTNNGVHTRATDKVKFNDIIEITLPQDKNEITPVNMPIKILYEDEHLIAIDKSAHMTMHPVHGHLNDTLANALAYYADQKGEEWTFRAVNRLDRDTSGVVLIAKNMYSAPILSATVRKKYIAVCEGIIESGGTIDSPIRIKDGHTIQRETGADGVNAITHYNPIRHGGGHTLTEFELETGRTHQIRVHMASIGHPLAGDDMYGGSLDMIARQALHCTRVVFLHPGKRGYMTIDSPIPKEFYDIIQGAKLA